MRRDFSFSVAHPGCPDEYWNGPDVGMQGTKPPIEVICVPDAAASTRSTSPSRHHCAPICSGDGPSRGSETWHCEGLPSPSSSGSDPPPVTEEEIQAAAERL